MHIHRSTTTLRTEWRMVSIKAVTSTCSPSIKDIVLSVLAAVDRNIKETREKKICKQDYRILKKFMIKIKRLFFRFILTTHFYFKCASCGSHDIEVIISWFANFVPLLQQNLYQNFTFTFVL